MNIPVKFSESNTTFSVNMSGTDQAAKANVGELQVVHDGQNGATFYPSVSEDGIISWTNNRELENPPPVNIRGKDGYTPVKGVDYFDGKDGVNGRDGQDGYTPVKGVDYFDGRNGVDGKDGYTPIKGVDYVDGKNGKDGYTPVKGVDYFDGKDGQNGKDGLDGKTPVKGEDYYTESDKAEMVSAVIAALPKYDGEVVAV